MIEWQNKNKKNKLNVLVNYLSNILVFKNNIGKNFYLQKRIFFG